MGKSTAFKEGSVVAQRYRLLAPLGRGAMGEVWRAEHMSLRAPVALKLIDPSLLAESSGEAREELFARFEREAQAAARLQSVHVVQVTDHGFDNQVPYIAMELLDGETLADQMERDGKLSAVKTMRILTHLGRAMTRAHEAGIVHRDLKPENIFLVRNDDEEITKVLDFGIAKIMRSPLDIAPKATSTGQLMGTPCYMSPEQASGEGIIDHRSDLWAMAVITYECLTGHLPFLSQNIGGLVLAICSHPPPVPSTVDPTLPASFDAWWARGVARDAGARFQSARELVGALRAVLDPTAGAGAVSEPGSLLDTSVGLPVVAAATTIESVERPPALDTQSAVTTHRQRRSAARASMKRYALVALVIVVGVLAVVTTRGPSRERAGELPTPAGKAEPSALAGSELRPVATTAEPRSEVAGDPPDAGTAPSTPSSSAPPPRPSARARTLPSATPTSSTDPRLGL